jgi:4-amino-4-deoxy-L-arabinose transferase-like glycosyltransferase
VHQARASSAAGGEATAEIAGRERIIVAARGTPLCGSASLDRWLRRMTVARLAGHERALLSALVLIAAALRAALIATSPAPFGYVWDFYHEGVRLLWSTGRLPASTECWQCYHPPLFYVLGLPLYAFGRWTAAGPGADSAGLRWLSGLATLSAAATIYYGYRLLRLFRCRGASLILGVALLVTFPCLFISSYGAEADILLTALLSAFLYYLTRDVTPQRPIHASVRLGVLAGLAAATKYSGLVAIVSAMILFAGAIVGGPRRRLAVRNAAIVVVVCALVGGWKYIDNFHAYGTPFFANGSAAEGFAISGGARFRGRYEFTTLRLRALLQLVGGHESRGPLTQLPVYRSVPTTLHALAWSDMTFFSDPSRHGDPSHPYKRKRVSGILIGAVLLLGFVPELLAAIGLIVTMRRRLYRPLAIVCGVSVSAYLWWFLSQDAWALKTKYLLFLLPAFVVYAVTGLAWLWHRGPRLGVLAAALVTLLVVIAHIYLLAFALA